MRLLVSRTSCVLQSRRQEASALGSGPERLNLLVYSVNTRFQGKVALITGGGTGIGRATAELMLKQGGQVFVVGRRRDPLAGLADTAADRVGYLPLDVTAHDASKRAVAACVETFGRLDVLINNAGMSLNRQISETTDADMDTVLDLNLKAPLRLVREALPHLRVQKGCVVNVSSTLARWSMSGTTIYATSKAALERMTRTLAVELGPLGVRINAVAPGVTETAMDAPQSDTPEASDQFSADAIIAQTPLGRIGLPHDIALAIAFLASDEAAWITGQTLQSSGGFML